LVPGRTKEDHVDRVRRISGVLVIGLIAWLSLAGTPQAQDYPTRPIRLVIAFPAGGPTDFVGRVIGEKLKTLLGQSIVVDNRPGANGAIGADYVAKSEPDGYTLFLTTVGAVAITPSLRSNLGYDSLRDFAPIMRVVQNTTILVVKPDMPVNSATDLAALAKAKPETISIASTGIGSMPHLALELYQSSAGVKFLHVPYRGAAPALTDLLGGQVQGFFADAPVLMSQIQAGTIKPIGAASNKRTPVLPNVPTLAEQGFPDTDAGNWYGLLAPARTPAGIIAKLNSAVTAALNDPEVRQKLIQSGAEPMPSTPDEFGQLLKSEIDRWGRIIREKGIKES
jgi:tripartite-type tricarboxylate transporter receptor subunit TctC